MVEKYPLDIGCILLATVIKPVSTPFKSGPFSVADYQGHIFSVSVKDGKGFIVSGAPGPKVPTDFSKQINSTTDNQISKLSNELKHIIEEVNDVKIESYQLQWGIKEGSPPTLLGCNGTEVTAPPLLIEFQYLIPVFSLFYAAESSAQIIQSQCITKGKNCCGGSQTIERSKVISIKIKKLCEYLDLAEDDQYTNYLKKRFSTLLPMMMMANVPVCPACFKYYSFKANVDKNSKTQKTNNGAQNRERLRPKTAVPERRSSLPPIKPEKPFGEIGDMTASGLRYTQEFATKAVQFAHLVYRNPPFNRPYPLPPPSKSRNSKKVTVA